MSGEEVYFYLPPLEWPNESHDLESLHSKVQKSWPLKNRRGINGGGIHNWILLTYFYLREYGFGCKLVDYLPERGIVIAHRDTLPDDFKPRSNSLLVCVQADRGRHPFAHIHIIQNRNQSSPSNMPRSDRYLFPGSSYFIKHWPEPTLLKRDSARNGRFENIAFLGSTLNLATELRSNDWERALKALGLNWLVIETPEQWRDYRDLDAIVAVRSFDKNPYFSKPASKLFNAWMAEVPAILGGDSAFENERKSGFDYIRVTTPKEALDAIKKLQNDEKFRQKMIENGKKRSEEIQPSALIEDWKFFFSNVAIPSHDKWCKQSLLKRDLFLKIRSLGFKIKHLSGTL